MFIEVMVYWSPDNYEELEACGQKIKYTTAPLHLNTDQLVGFHTSDDGELILRLTNGDVFRSPVKFDSFKNRITEINEEENSFLISGSN